MGNGPSREKNRQKTDELRDFVFAFFLYAYILYAPETSLPVLCSAGTTRPIRLKIPPTDATNQKGPNEEQKEG